MSDYELSGILTFKIMVIEGINIGYGLDIFSLWFITSLPENGKLGLSIFIRWFITKPSEQGNLNIGHI